MIVIFTPFISFGLVWFQPALFNMVKSIFSDTNLVVAGTVLTLALSLAAEEGAAPHRLAQTIWSAIWSVLGPGGHGPSEDGSLKEL